MTVQQDVSLGMPPKAQRQVEAYDFRRPTTLAREHARVLEMAFDTFGRQWGTQLTAKVRVLSQVTSEQVQTMTYDEYVASLPEDTGMVLFSMPNISAKAVIQFPMAAALSWVRHMLGGTGNQPAPERKLTHIEQALLSRIMDEALEDLHYALGSLLAAPLSPSSIQYNSQFAQAAGSTVPMIVARFEMVVGDAAAPATVALPAEAILPQLGPVRPNLSDATPAELVTEQLANLPVDVSLQLNPIRVKPGLVLDLAVGDVLNLDHPQHRPLNVTVDGQTLAQAAVGASGSRLAGVIVSTEENI
ncbi:flagellar motor switch protein FliM [Arthrobacter koreensis]|uniref:Flagellar motor switch protein FliM n=2 Tax=Arthrobacter koreensis TaxID=199136 RepID=A0ABY6FTM5_9MICC|nr:flagellar motor switch protein FliM [Arthrobacter koreensis]MEB7447829.1 flagellar motor switch protein FliM [Arthrobacter koreensis]UYB36573.1 flagellar motor switch protein FliM [Arthrobacter koreensis]